MRPGPHSWEELASKDLTGSMLTATIYGRLLNVSLTRIEAVEAVPGRYRFLSDEEVIAALPVQPRFGPLVDEQNSESELLHFAIGNVGEGFIALPCSVTQFFAEPV